MTKYVVTVVRTYTYRTQLEAETLQELDTLQERLLSRLTQGDFDPVAMDRTSVEAVFHRECHDCHNAECFLSFPWCQECAKKNHTRHFLATIAALNERMKNTRAPCSRCGVGPFGCVYYDHPRFGMMLYCPACSTSVGKQLQKEGEHNDE